MKSTLPTVAIVGRPNVGKSALFNRLAQRQIAIVHDQPGVTRDRLVANCRLGKDLFTVVDTGGIGYAVTDAFDERVRLEARLAMEMADVIVLVADGREGRTAADEMIAKELRVSRKPILVAVNKLDHDDLLAHHHEFSELGFAGVVPISAAHGRGIQELVSQIESLLPPAESVSEVNGQHTLKLAIVGRPNVGKSSLVNAILQDQRTIVSDIAGTTRDAVDIPYRRNGKDFVLIDTAGIRPRGKQNSSVEVFSVIRAEKSIKRADICALVIDGVDGVTSQDKRIAGLILESEKPCIVVVNKLDLVKPPTRVKEFLDAVLGQIRSQLFFLNYAPIDLISAHTRENLDRLFRSIEKIEQHAERQISTGPLNRILQSAFELHPPPLRGNRRLKLMYATHVAPRETGTVSAPTFLLFVNHRELLSDDYRRYLESRIRAYSGYYGLPIVFNLRDRN